MKEEQDFSIAEFFLKKKEILSRRQFVQNQKLLEKTWNFLLNFGIVKNHLTFTNFICKENLFTKNIPTE